MGRLIDIEEVLKLDCLSQKARKKIDALPAMNAISHRATWVYKEEHRDSWEEHELACVLLCAYRYAVGRHGTRCLERGDLGDVILSNLHLMNDDFIRQMIDGVYEQRRWHSLSKEHRYPILRIESVLGDFAEAICWLIEQKKIKECEKLSKIVAEVNRLSRDIQWLEKDLREPLEKVCWDDDTSYLDPFLEALQVEYEKRGYKRIEEE